MKEIGVLLVNLSASHPKGRGFEPCCGHDHTFSFDTGNKPDFIQESDQRVV
jgi:hypothetical protein